MATLVCPVGEEDKRAPMSRLALAAGGLAVLALVAVLAVSISHSTPSTGEVELANRYSALQVGRYAVRAERQAKGYRLDAERQIQLATNNDNEATDDNAMAIEEEKRARASAYLAADAKERIEKTLNAGRDQVHQSTKLKAKAGRLSDKADNYMKVARKKLKSAKRHNRAYRALMKRYGRVVDKYDKTMQKRAAVLDQINNAGLKLADDMTAYSKASGAKKAGLKLKVNQDRSALALLETKHMAVNLKARKAKQLTDKYQPVIIRANRNQADSQNNYADYTRLKHHANKLYTKAAQLMDRADTIDGLIQTTERDLKSKRKNFLHYKNRAETEMSISLHAEDQEDQLRRAARHSRYLAGKLFDKARRLEKLAQKGLNEVMRQHEEAEPNMMGLQTGYQGKDQSIMKGGK